MLSRRERLHNVASSHAVFLMTRLQGALPLYSDWQTKELQPFYVDALTAMSLLMASSKRCLPCNEALVGWKGEQHARIYSSKTFLSICPPGRGDALRKAVNG